MELKGKITRKLFDQNPLQSNFCFYSGGEIPILANSNIFGIGGSISQRGALLPVCVLNLPSSKKPEKIWQLIKSRDVHSSEEYTKMEKLGYLLDTN